MALINTDIKNMTTGVQLASRNDYCYLCAKEIKAKNEDDYNQQFKKLVGAQEGKKVLKVGRTQGSEITICLECLHKITKDNPLPKE